MSAWGFRDYTRDEREERAAYRDAVDDAELAYLEALDAAARAAWERTDNEYHPEDDPYMGETTGRYEEGRMP